MIRTRLSDHSDAYGITYWYSAHDCVKYHGHFMKEMHYFFCSKPKAAYYRLMHRDVEAFVKGF